MAAALQKRRSRMLQMNGIRKVYRTDLVETHALEGLSVTVGDGEFVSIMGPSGSGKTTCLNIAGLLDVLDGGSYRLDNQDVSRLSDREMSHIRNRNIGFIFQSFNLIPDLDVFDNVDVPLRYRGLSAPERKRRIEKAVDLVGLTSRMHHLPSQLSGGQQQRVAIARALAAFTTVRHMFARDPLPGKSNKLFCVRMDNWDPANAYPQGEEGLKNPHPLPPQITLRDANELLRSNIPVRQTATYYTVLAVF